MFYTSDIFFSQIMERRKYGFPDVFGVRMVRSADPGLVGDFGVPNTRPGKFAVWKARKAADKVAGKLVRIGRSADPGLGEKFGTMAGKFTTKVGKAVDNVAGKIYFG